MLEGLNAGISFRTVHDPVGRITHMVLPNVGTRWGPVCGSATDRPTVRRAELPRRDRMAKKRMPVRRKGGRKPRRYGRALLRSSRITTGYWVVVPGPPAPARMVWCRRRSSCPGSTPSYSSRCRRVAAGLAFSPDGRAVATAAADGTAAHK